MLFRYWEAHGMHKLTRLCLLLILIVHSAIAVSVLQAAKQAAERQSPYLLAAIYSRPYCHGKNGRFLLHFVLIYDFVFADFLDVFFTVDLGNVGEK